MYLTIFAHVYRLLCPIVISFSLLDCIRKGEVGDDLSAIESITSHVPFSFPLLSLVGNF